MLLCNLLVLCFFGSTVIINVIVWEVIVIIWEVIVILIGFLNISSNSNSNKNRFLIHFQY